MPLAASTARCNLRHQQRRVAAFGAFGQSPQRLGRMERNRWMSASTVAPPETAAERPRLNQTVLLWGA